MDPGIDRCQVYCWVCVYGMAIEQFPRDDRTQLHSFRNSMQCYLQLRDRPFRLSPVMLLLLLMLLF